MRRRALIIGISEYDRLARLSFCQNDADGMNEVLRWAGYDIPNYNKLTGYVDLESMRNTTTQLTNLPTYNYISNPMFYLSQVLYLRCKISK
jgi:hypothetical protein